MGLRSGKLMQNAFMRRGNSRWTRLDKSRARLNSQNPLVIIFGISLVNNENDLSELGVNRIANKAIRSSKQNLMFLSQPLLIECVYFCVPLWYHWISLVT